MHTQRTPPYNLLPLQNILALISYHQGIIIPSLKLAKMHLQYCIYESEQRLPRCAILWNGLLLACIYEYKIPQLSSDWRVVKCMQTSCNLAWSQAIIKHLYANYFNYFPSLKL
jgi:hypothetical protein